MTYHYPISISQLERTVYCPGSVKLSLPYANGPQTEEQLEGHAGHWVASEMLLNRRHTVGTVTPFGPIVDADMIEGAEMYWTHIANTLGAKVNTPGANIQYGIEQTLPCPRIHADAGGTPDFWAYDPSITTLYIPDYKYGHKYVEEFENWQGIGYACAVMNELKLHDENVWVVFTLVQPRYYHKEGPIRTWHFKASSIRALINKAAMASEEAFYDDPPTRTGPHCEFCPGRADCATLQQTTSSLIDFAGTADPTPLTPQAIGVELHLITSAMERLEARQTGLQAQAAQLLRQGKQVPFWKMDETPGRTTWDKPAEEVAAAAAVLSPNVNLFKPRELITPTQAAKAGLDAVVSLFYSSRKSGAIKMVPDSLTQTRKVFSNHGHE